MSFWVRVLLWQKIVIIICIIRVFSLSNIYFEIWRSTYWQNLFLLSDVIIVFWGPKCLKYLKAEGLAHPVYLLSEHIWLCKLDFHEQISVPFLWFNHCLRSKSHIYVRVQGLRAQKLDKFWVQFVTGGLVVMLVQVR